MLVRQQQGKCCLRDWQVDKWLTIKKEKFFFALPFIPENPEFTCSGQTLQLI